MQNFTSADNVTNTHAWAATASRFAWHFVTPFVIVIGTIGNLLCVCVLARRRMRHLPSSAYLLVLAVTDTGALWLYVMPRWLRELDISLRDVSSATCKIGMSLPQFTTWYSAWLLVAVTAQRYVAVSRPLLAITVDTRKTAAIIMMSLFAVLFVGIVPPLFMMDKRAGKCQIVPGYETFMLYVYNWLDATVYFIVPFSALLTMNCLIIYHVRQSREIRPLSTSTASADSTAHVTAMLLTISFVFLATSLPVFIIILFFSSNNAHDPRLAFAADLALIINFSNHALNFFLYCASGLKFRQQLCALVCRRHDATTHTVTQSRTTRYEVH